MLILDDYKKLLELVKKEKNTEDISFLTRKLEIVIKSIELKNNYDDENEKINKLAMDLYKDMKPADNEDNEGE